MPPDGQHLPAVLAMLGLSVVGFLVLLLLLLQPSSHPRIFGYGWLVYGWLIYGWLVSVIAFAPLPPLPGFLAMIGVEVRLYHLGT